VKDGLLVKEILGVQLVVRVKTGGHYGGLNFFEGDKKMYSVSRTRKKKSFRFCSCCRFRYVEWVWTKLPGHLVSAPGMLDAHRAVVRNFVSKRKKALY